MTVDVPVMEASGPGCLRAIHAICTVRTANAPGGLQAYKRDRKPLPAPPGPTSIMTIVQQRLEAAGLRKAPTPSGSMSKAKARARATRHERFALPPPDPDTTPRVWEPLHHIPYVDLQRKTKRERRRSSNSDAARTRGRLRGACVKQVRSIAPALQNLGCRRCA